jgi:lysophospholipase L1-like esterase
MPTRRHFLAAAAGGGAAALASACRALPVGRSSSAPALPDDAVILFQGDSITDAGRNRRVTDANVAGALGTGYPLLVASALLGAQPERRFRFHNRGISGNKVPDLAARWEEDALALKPNLLSILIGVNDYWHKRNGRYAGTVAQYESGYAALLERTRRALPDVRLLVLEPFVLRVGAVDASWFPEFDDRRAAAERVARGAGATFVPLHAAFEELGRKTGPAYWAADGVHPTPAGHALIARKWREAAEL